MNSFGFIFSVYYNNFESQPGSPLSSAPREIGVKCLDQVSYYFYDQVSRIEINDLFSKRYLAKIAENNAEDTFTT